jgi:hypothetical protein
MKLAEAKAAKVNQARFKGGYVADGEISSAFYDNALSQIDTCGRENDTVLPGLSGPHEKIYTGSFQRFEEVSFTFGNSRHRGNSFSQTGGCYWSKEHRGTRLDERGPLERNDCTKTQLTDKYDIIAIHLHPAVGGVSGLIGTLTTIHHFFRLSQ